MEQNWNWQELQAEPILEDIARQMFSIDKKDNDRKASIGKSMVGKVKITYIPDVQQERHFVANVAKVATGNEKERICKIYSECKEHGIMKRLRLATIIHSISIILLFIYINWFNPTFG